MNDNCVILNYIDLVSLSIMNFLNEEEPMLNSKGKYFIKLTAKNKRKLRYYLKSNLKNNKHFGKQTIIVKPCEIKNNWRRGKFEDFSKGSEYSICDHSVYLDPNTMKSFFDKKYDELKKSQTDCIFIDIKDVDSMDLLFILHIFLMNLCKNIGYHIVEDGNKVYSRMRVIPKYILSKVETELRRQSLIV